MTSVRKIASIRRGVVMARGAAADEPWSEYVRYVQPRERTLTRWYLGNPIDRVMQIALVRTAHRLRDRGQWV